jgi:CBS domain-containing protein
MKVCEVMTEHPVRCDPSDSLNRAAQIMWERECESVPVVDGIDELIGMVSDRDVAMAAYTQGKRLAEIEVTSAMVRRVFCCEGGSSVEIALATMREHGLKTLPIIDTVGKLIGMVSLETLRRAAAPIATAIGVRATKEVPLVQEPGP